jgi:hypothetical protein
MDMDLNKAKFKISSLFDKYWNEITAKEKEKEIENKENLLDLEYNILAIIDQISLNKND